MTLGEKARRGLLLIAAAACAASWLSVGGAVLIDWPRWAFFATVFAAALSTEALFWAGAVVLGWTAFANRARLWSRFTGGKRADAQTVDAA
ncbi:MAG: hypothetical protein AAFX09_11085 [Pseudomonadota bacterium]